METQTEKKEVTLPSGVIENVVQTAGEVIETEVQAKPEEKIIFRGREFKSQAEATEFFEKLEDENRANERARIEAEAYNMGIRDALSKTVAPIENVVEEDLETEFYQDVKGTLNKVHARAKEEAVTEIRRELAAERAWDQFCREYPDLADSREEVVRILQANPHIAQIKDEGQGRKELATKVRSYFQGIAEKFAPTKELPPNKTQAVSAGGGAAPSSVTQQTKNGRPLTFVEQMQKAKVR